MHALDYWLPFIGVAAGYIFGALITWLLLRNRLNTTKARLDERLRGSEKHAAELEAGAANLEQEVTQMRHSEAAALKQQGSLEGLLAAERKAVQEKMKLLNKAEERMLDSFRLISKECLHEGQADLTAAIKASFEGQQQDNREEILPLLEPLANSLDRIESRLATLEDERQGASRLLREHIVRAAEEVDEPASAPAPRASAPPASAPTPRASALPSPPQETRPLSQSPIANDSEHHDPRPYATPAPASSPAAIRTRPRSTPSTFMEDLDGQPLPSSFKKVSYRTAESAIPIVGLKSLSESDEALPPVKLRPFEDLPVKHDVLDEDLGHDFEGFEAVTLKNVQENEPDPQRAADDLRAALES